MSLLLGKGAVNTPIWDKQSVQYLSQYDDTEYHPSLQTFQDYITGIGKAGYSPEVVRKLIRQAFESKHPKARYAIVPDAISNWYLPRILPARWLDKLIGKQLGLRLKQ